jgi:hypothetical protein
VKEIQMRRLTVDLVLVFLAGTIVSCAPSGGTATTGRHEPGDANSSVVMSGGKAVLRLTLPPGAQSFSKAEPFIVADSGGNFRFFLWTVNDARTLDEAASRVPGVIRSEFRAFKLADTTDLTVAGAPAKQLTGSGAEADDGDPGNAVVVLFTAGGRVFAACVHGEGNPSAALREFMLATIQTAQAP